MATDVVSQIASREIVHDQVEVLPILKGVVHVDDEWVLELGQDLTLVDDGLDASLGDDPSLAHLLHGEVLLGFLPLDSPNLSKATLSDAKVVHKVRLRDG